MSGCRFRNRNSSVIEVILMLPHSHWWGKFNTPYMEYVVFLALNYHIRNIKKLPYHKVDKLMIQDSHSVNEI